MTDEKTAPARVDELERAGALADAAALARRLAEEAAEPAAQANALVRAAELLAQAAGPAQAMPLLRDALAAARRAGRQDLEALALAETARLELYGRDAEALGRAERSLDHAQAALRRFRGQDEASTRSRLAHYRGLLASRRGEPAQAVRRLREAYEAAVGDPAQQARVLNSWGLQLEPWAEPEEARRLLERSLELKLELGDLWGTAATYGSLAFLHTRCGAYADAREALARDLEIAERIGARDLLPGLHARLAGALLGMGRLAGAEREAQQAIDLTDVPQLSVPAARAAGFAWRELARVRREQGRLVDAEETARDRALGAFERLREPYGAALARLTLAEIGLERHALAGRSPEGDATALERAAADLDAARRVFARLGAVHELAECLLLFARLRHAAGDAGRAVETIRDRVLPLVERMARGAPHLRREALDLLARFDPQAADRRVDVLAGSRRVETTLADRAGEPGEWTVVAARVSSAAHGARLAQAAAAEGGILVWFPPARAAALFAGDDAAERAAALRRRLRGLATAAAAGEAVLSAPWPAPPTASGPAVDEALRRLPRPATRPRTKPRGGRR
jgi:tetratricopeptide (TPR) repeat protein